MNKNDVIELAIEDLTAEGNGVGKAGITVFVPEALPGDVISAKIVKVKKNYAYGKILEIKQSSPNRIESKCPVSDKCGGCQFQHYDYKAQLAFKENLVKNALQRIGGCENPPVLPILGMDKPYNYRNKAQFVGGMGFYAQRSHRLIPVSDCNIQRPECNEVLRKVQGLSIPVYDEETHTGLLRHVVVRVGKEEIMVILVFNEKNVSELPKTEIAFDNLLINENTAKTNVILGKSFKLLNGSGYIYDEIGHIRYRISPRAFFQVNSEQCKVLYDNVAKHIGDGERVVDAYSGIGGIALYIAGKAESVIAIESVPEAVEDGQYNAGLNCIDNVEFVCGLAEDFDIAEGSCDTIVLDPPRKGCDGKLLDMIVSREIPKVVYVSCDPATLARDVKRLCAGGYQVGEVQPVDLFPMTGHVETVVLLSLGDAHL